MKGLDKTKILKILTVVLVISGLFFGFAVRSQWIDISSLTPWSQNDYSNQESIAVSDTPDFITSSLVFDSGTSFENGLIVGTEYGMTIHIQHSRSGWYLNDHYTLSTSYDGGSTWTEIHSGDLTDLESADDYTDSLTYTPDQTGDCTFKLDITGMSWSETLATVNVVSSEFVESTNDLTIVSSDIEGAYNPDSLITTTWTLQKNGVGGWLYGWDYILEYSNDGGSTWNTAVSGTHDITQAGGGSDNGSGDYYIMNGDQYTFSLDHTTPVTTGDYTYRLTLSNLDYQL